MHVGDIVIPSTSDYLSHGQYYFGIVVDTNPFVVASSDGEMIWHHLNPSHMHTLCSAHPDIFKKAYESYKSESLIGITREVLFDALTALNYGISYARDMLEQLKKDANQMNQSNVMTATAVYNKGLIETTNKNVACMIRARENLQSIYPGRN